jgi:hypothetical protein
MEDSVMKLKTERKALSSALGIVSRVLAPQSSYQDISKHILASANGNGRLVLTATNLELTISASVEAEIENPGTVAIPGKRMTEWVKLMGKETVSFSLDEANSLSFRCGSKATLKCLGPDIFPEIELKDTDGAEMDAGLLKKAIRHVAFAASKGEMRPVLTGVLINLEGNKLSLSATDGYRLSVQNTELSQPVIDRMHVIVPAQALRELERILPDEGQLKLYLSEDNARLGSESPVDEIVAFEDRGEMAKAMIAGYRGHTGAEFLDFALRLAEKALQLRRERMRVIVVVHDGCPVAKWNEGGSSVKDWDISQLHVRSLERHGVPVIGLYLGDDDGNVKRMQELFPHLATCQAENLPDKLGNLLRSLA